MRFGQSGTWFAVLATALGCSGTESGPSGETGGRTSEAILTASFALNGLLGQYGDTAPATPPTWTGADSTYSALLPDGRVAWMFSDTFLGTVSVDHSRDPQSLIHNSVVLQDAKSPPSFTTLVDSNPTSGFFTWPVGNTSTWFFVGAPVVQARLSQLRVFLFQHPAAGGAQIGTAVAKIALPQFQLETVEDITGKGFVPIQHNTCGGFVSYGTAALQLNGYTYIYGVEDCYLAKYVYLARVVGDYLVGNPWTYYTGSGPCSKPADAGWCLNPSDAARLTAGGSAFSAGADEISVTQTGPSSFRLVASALSLGNIEAYTASAPEGPWSAGKVLYAPPGAGGRAYGNAAKMQNASGTLQMYNAKEHPEFESPGTVFLSYNRNSFNSAGSADLADTFLNVDNYRPVFVEIVDDAVQGGSPYQFTYVGGGWGHCTACDVYGLGLYEGSWSWDKTTGDYLTMPFTGKHIELYGFVSTNLGIGAVSIDGGAEADVDFYSGIAGGYHRVWSADLASAGAHTLKLRVTGRKNQKSSDVSVSVDAISLMP